MDRIRHAHQLVGGGGGRTSLKQRPERGKRSLEAIEARQKRFEENNRKRVLSDVFEQCLGYLEDKEILRLT